MKRSAFSMNQRRTMPALLIQILFATAMTVVAVIAISANERETPVPRITLDWGGKTWSVRGSSGPVGPLDNYFNPLDDSVFVDGDGRMHLRIKPSQVTGIWQASEIVLKRRLGYGTYIWKVDSPLADLDPSAVLGLFTWSENARYANREIDIEFSAWGDGTRPEQGQYVVQPYNIQGNMKTFSLGKAIGPTTHAFMWLPDRIEFASWTGFGPWPDTGAAAGAAEGTAAGAAEGATTTSTTDKPAAGGFDKSVRGLDKPGVVIASWVFTEAARIPKPGNEYLHINFYLAEGGVAPSRGKPLEVILSGFTFTPWKKK